MPQRDRRREVTVYLNPTLAEFIVSERQKDFERDACRHLLARPKRRWTRRSSRRTD